ncbi:URK1 (YNR012W) [Zygosaccharomyces parabailii]|nr:URK1 (YNR012W) [Zygosaccharomyces parabailii]CDH11008.1 probable Uridine kinase [Zygosaccharomyces bailii ISA1307]
MSTAIPASSTIPDFNNDSKAYDKTKYGEKLGSKYLPPWTTPYIIGVGGPSGSGKTSVAAKIVSSLNVPWTVLISLDNFYKPLNALQREQAFQNRYDFDHPSAIDLDLAYQSILSLKEGKKTTIPVYSFVEHNRVPNKNITIYGASVIVLEGIYTLYDKRLLELMDLKIYVDADLDVCLARRLSRDIVYRGRALEGSLEQWERFVKPNAEQYLKPTMRDADAIVPSLTDNGVAVELIINHIRSRLQQKSEEHLKELIKLGYSNLTPVSENSSMHELESTNQVKALVTMLLDKTTNRYDFVFYFDRIATILLTQALHDIPVYEQCKMETPSGGIVPYALRCNFNQVTAINLIESGDCFMHSLKKAIPNVVTGKLLVQSDSQTGEPQLHYEKLPPGIDTYEMVLLTEAQMISGASMIMSIQVLLDHKVELENIKVVVFLATEISVRRILNAFHGKVDIYAAKVVTKNELANCDWAKVRFVGAKYFGW